MYSMTQGLVKTPLTVNKDIFIPA